MEKKTTRSTEEYLASMHRLGRGGAIMSIFIMLAIPTVIAVVYGTFPGVPLILKASAGLLAIFIPVAISEVISFTPILGSSVYVTFITGNVTNLKIPVVTNAINKFDIKYGTEEADVMSAIAACTSAITTVIIVGIGVVLMVPLSPILSNPSVETATGYVLPALFGALALGVLGSNIGGGMKAKGRLKGAILPVIIVLLLCFWNAELMAEGRGILILLMIPVTFFGSKQLFKKGQIKVTTAEERKEK